MKALRHGPRATLPHRREEKCMSNAARKSLARRGGSPKLSAGSPMDLLQLEHFLAVVEERTFTRAAERVCRTQPAVSQSIKKLEEEVGTPLFARDVHDVSLTEAGKALVEYARKMVHTRDAAMRMLGSLKHLSSEIGRASCRERG